MVRQARTDDTVLAMKKRDDTAVVAAGRRGKDDRKLKYIGPVGAPPLSLINRFIVTPKNTLPPFHCRSADYSQPHFDSFGTFMRRLAFALASIYLPL